MHVPGLSASVLFVAALDIRNIPKARKYSTGFTTSSPMSSEDAEIDEMDEDPDDDEWESEPEDDS